MRSGLLPDTTRQAVQQDKHPCQPPFCPHRIWAIRPVSVPKRKAAGHSASLPKQCDILTLGGFDVTMLVLVEGWERFGAPPYLGADCTWPFLGHLPF